MGKPYYQAAESVFIEKTEGIHFGVFCIIYSIVLIMILKKLTKKKAWRPKNRELKCI